jgi:hypothetical protein
MYGNCLLMKVEHMTSDITQSCGIFGRHGVPKACSTENRTRESSCGFRDNDLARTSPALQYEIVKSRIEFEFDLHVTCK